VTTATGSLLLPKAKRAAPTFHTLTVHSVEQLTDDAVAVSFDVPAELAAAYEFVAGQSLTLRRTIYGQEHRRT
jgi:ring-1,2-phenylacetyl-CoA epoxidase subunit PaaE